MNSIERNAVRRTGQGAGAPALTQPALVLQTLAAIEAHLA